MSRPRIACGLVLTAILPFAAHDLRPARAAEHTTDSLATVREAVRAKKAVIVDVREKGEWDAGHLKDARFVPLSGLAKDAGLQEALKFLPKGQPIYIHCKAGARCLVAADLLKDQGLDLRPLKAGYVDLRNAGFEAAAP